MGTVLDVAQLIPVGKGTSGMAQINYELSLKNLKILKKDEGSLDEPFLWVIFLKIDGSTVSVANLANATATVIAPEGDHGDLGPAGDEMDLGDAVSIPVGIGTIRDKLISIAGLPDATAESFAVVSAFVVALEEDATHDDAIEKGRKALVDTLATQVNKALQSLMQPDVDQITKLAKSAVADAIKSASFSVLSFFPISSLLDVGGILDPDDSVGSALAGPFSMAQLRNSGPGGIPITLNLGGPAEDNGFYQVTGIVRSLGPFFAGVWHPSGGKGDLFEAGDNFGAFAAKVGTRAKLGWHLTSFKRFLSNGVEAWAGVWQNAGDKNQIFEAGDNFATFTKKLSDRQKLGWHLTSMQRFMVGSNEVWAGVWHTVDKNQMFDTGVDFNHFSKLMSDRAKQGWHLTSFQRFMAGANEAWAGVWHPVNNGQMFDIFNNIPQFAKQMDDRNKQGWHVSRFQRYMAGNAELWAADWHPAQNKQQLFDTGLELDDFVKLANQRANQGWHLTDFDVW